MIQGDAASLARNPNGLLINRLGLGLALAYLLLVLPLNYGITSVTLGPLPVHYAMMAIGLVSAAPYALAAPGLLWVPILLLVAGVFRLLIGDVGFWALRDASQVMDMQWIFIGWAIVRSGIAQPLLRWWPWYLLAIMLYWNTYPIRSSLEHIGPRTGLHGNGMFGHYNSQIWAAITLCTLLLMFDRIKVWHAVVIGGLAATFLLQTMSRIALGGTVMMGVYLVCLGRIRFATFAICCSIGVLGIMVAQVMELEVDTRYGKLDGSLLFNAVLSIVGEGNNHGAAAGVSQRAQWWTDGINGTLSEPHGWLWGQGYGVVLTDHGVAGDVTTRELHNSWLSSFCRLGLVGLTGLCVLYFGSLLKIIMACGSDWRHFAIIFATFTGLVTLFEPGFENPQTSSLIWSILGCGLALAARQEERWAQMMTDEGSEPLQPGEVATPLRQEAESTRLSK